MDDTKNYKKLENDLKSDLFDQEIAIDILIKTLIKNKTLQHKEKIGSIFTFIGAPNCGKHYLCELLNQHSSNIETIKTYYMDQYNFDTQKFDSTSFKKELIEFCKDNPKSVLVFEDIEKADLQIQLILYTLFTDYERENLDLSNIIVVFTTTVLSSLIGRKDFRTMLKEDPFGAHTYLMERLVNEKISVVGGGKEDAVDKKLLSLLNEHTLVPFNQLSLQALVKIAEKSLHDITFELEQQNNVAISYTSKHTFTSLITLSLAPYINARYVKQTIPKFLFNNVYDNLKLAQDIKKINYKVSKKAKNFLEDILKDEGQFITKTVRQHNRINLKWEIKQKDDELDCIIKGVEYKKEKISIEKDDDIHVSDISFNDIAGQEKVKEELSEILTLLKEPNRLKHFELNIPKGVFLYGPSGMGKRLLARAFAHEANMPYIVVNGSDLFDRNYIHNVYDKAYQCAPAIIIFENIDTQGILNGMLSTMSLEPIMEELDRLHQSYESPVFTILTLGNHENIPDDLLRVDRINLQVEVPKLDMDARRFFIEQILQKPHDKTINIERVVRYISGMGGDELKRIGQEASLYAARKGLKELTEDILLEQINIIKYGSKLESKHIRDIEKSMEKTAYHEAGHAVLSYVLLPETKIEQVTVAPRSKTLGFVSYHDEEYFDAISKEEIFNTVCVLLAGRIAKMEKFGENGMETGAVSDLEAATLQIYAAIALFGMDDELGYVNVSGFELAGGNLILQDKIEERLLVWMEKAKEHTQKEVKRLWSAIDAVAKELIKKEVINASELEKIIKKKIKTNK